MQNYAPRCLNQTKGTTKSPFGPGKKELGENIRQKSAGGGSLVCQAIKKSQTEDSGITQRRLDQGEKTVTNGFREMNLRSKGCRRGKTPGNSRGGGGHREKVQITKTGAAHSTSKTQAP